MIIIRNTLKPFLILIINVLKPGATGGDDETPASKCEFWRRKGKQARAREERKSRAEKVRIVFKWQKDCLSRPAGKKYGPE